MIHFEPTIGHLILLSGLLGPANQVRADHFHKHHHGNLAEMSSIPSRTLNPDWMDFPTQNNSKQSQFVLFGQISARRRDADFAQCPLMTRSGHSRAVAVSRKIHRTRFDTISEYF
jgi:hypothetical protein